MENYHSDIGCKKCGENRADFLKIRHTYKSEYTPEHLSVTCLRCLYKWKIRVYEEEEES